MTDQRMFRRKRGGKGVSEQDPGMARGWYQSTDVG